MKKVDIPGCFYWIGVTLYLAYIIEIYILCCFFGSWNYGWGEVGYDFKRKSLNHANFMLIVNMGFHNFFAC